MSRLRFENIDLDQADTNALLQAKVSAVLAFVDKNGFPRMVPCWFLWEDGCFFISSLKDKFHVRCLRANPKASVCVEVSNFSDVPPAVGALRNQQVKGVGSVQLLDDADGAMLARIRSNYVAEGELPPLDQERVVIALQPDKLSAHGGAIRPVQSSS